MYNQQNERKTQSCDGRTDCRANCISTQH